MKSINIYTDGSCLNNPGPGGWCAILEYNGHRRTLSGSDLKTTNNRMELLAVIEALKQLKESCSITLYSDSQYVLNGIDKWINGWVQKNFKNVKNEDLWKDYLALSKEHEVHVVWIKGHSGHEENEICDTIARKEAQKVKDAHN